MRQNFLTSNIISQIYIIKVFVNIKLFQLCQEHKIHQNKTYDLTIYLMSCGLIFNYFSFTIIYIYIPVRMSFLLINFNMSIYNF